MTVFSILGRYERPSGNFQLKLSAHVLMYDLNVCNKAALVYKLERTRVIIINSGFSHMFFIK